MCISQCFIFTLMNGLWLNVLLIMSKFKRRLLLSTCSVDLNLNDCAHTSFSETLTCTTVDKINMGLDCFTLWYGIE